MKHTKPNRPGIRQSRIREYQIIKTDFIESCRTKRNAAWCERWSIGVSLLAALAIILFFTAATATEKPEQPESSSVVSSEPTATPTIAPTPTPTIAPTEVIVDLNRNIMALPTGSTGAFKAIEKITSITDSNSAQYKMKQFYRTDNLGFIRFNNYYVVAVGQYYSNRIGECFRVTFEERTITCMVGDVKRIGDTVDGMYCKENGSIIEFIINPEVMSADVMFGGDLSCLGMGGKVISIEKEELE